MALYVILCIWLLSENGNKSLYISNPMSGHRECLKKLSITTIITIYQVVGVWQLLAIIDRLDEQNISSSFHWSFSIQGSNLILSALL